MCGDVSFIFKDIDCLFCQSSTQFIVDFCLTLLVVLAEAVSGQPLSPGCEIEPHCGRTPRIVQQWVRELQTGMPNGCSFHDSGMGSSRGILEPGCEEGWTTKGLPKGSDNYETFCAAVGIFRGLQRWLHGEGCKPTLS